MEYIPGGMLFNHLRKHEIFSEKMARFYAAEVLLGLDYTAAAGLLPITLDETEGPAGSMFFVSYTMDDGGDPSSRPLSFCFNGGPGSASCWLHLGGLAPKKVELLPDGGMPPPPYVRAGPSQLLCRQAFPQG